MILIDIQDMKSLILIYFIIFIQTFILQKHPDKQNEAAEAYDRKKNKGSRILKT
jgi:hypothetical protein